MNLFRLKLFFILALFQAAAVFSQTDPVGKSYTALMGTSCEESTDGGCTIQRFCTLKFEKDSVAVSYFEKRYCNTRSSNVPREITVNEGVQLHDWSIKDSKITIKNFSDFGGLYLPKKNFILGYRETSGTVTGLSFKASEN